MGSTGDADRKRRQFSSLSPTAGAAKKQYFPPLSEDKKLDAVVLNFQNKKLRQKLETQKLEHASLSNKLYSIKERQQSYDGNLCVVKKAWGELVCELESRSAQTRESISRKDAAHFFATEDRDSSILKHVFLKRLSETGATENSSTNCCDEQMEVDLEAVGHKLHKITGNIAAAIDDLWHIKNQASLLSSNAVSEDGKTGSFPRAVSNDLLLEVKRLRSELCDLHLWHKSQVVEILKHRDRDAKNKFEIKLLHLMSSQCHQESSNHGSNSAKSASVNDLLVEGNDTPPLWRFVTRLEKIGAAGGTWKYKCNICEEVRTSSYFRVRAHLLQLPGHGIKVCSKVTRALKHEMQVLDDDYEKRKDDSKPREVSLPCESSAITGLKKRRSDQSPIVRAFGIETRDQLDQEIARMFYTGGLPFNFARNPHYMRSFTFAATHNIAGYKPPGYNKLRTTLLVQEKKNVENLMVPLRSTWKEKGVTIVSDGWSDPTRKPLINFMATSGNGPMFLKAVNCFGETKDKYFIARLMKEVIQEVGHQNVVQIITDNAANCKGAGELIESEFPHIYWTPCVVHTLNLALKNICAAKNSTGNEQTYEECHWITEIHGDAIQIKNFIMNHNMRLVIFQKFCVLKLLAVADTRFASIIVMLKRFKLIRRGLQSMIISDEWTSYREEDMGKANFVKEKLMNDDWWDKLTYIVDFTRPIYDMIRYCDTDKPCLHLVYEMWDSMIEKVKFEIFKKECRGNSDSSPFYDVVYDILVARWAKSNTPLHCLAHSLNPRFYSDEWLVEDSSRIAPHRDGEISRERMRCLRRLFANVGDQDKENLKAM